MAELLHLINLRETAVMEMYCLAINNPKSDTEPEKKKVGVGKKVKQCVLL